MHRVQPNKGYGQHFLKDSSVVDRTISYLRKGHSCNKILEIGPGTGALTKSLLQQFGDQLTCVEIDPRCVEYLEIHLPELKGRILQQDFLKVNLKEILSPQTTVTGNFPYNISSQIVFRVLEYRQNIPLMIGMFQKEVADRIAAKHGNKEYGILSVLTQVMYDTDVLFDIPPSAFNPPPKVMSSVLRLRRKPVLPEGLDVALLSKLVKAGFNQRRKMLRNAMSGVVPSEMLTDPFFQQRAEQLSVNDFVELSKRVAAFSADAI